MSDSPVNAASAREQGSGLSALRRVWLLTQNPRDAFMLFSSHERVVTGLLVFLLYCIIRFPFNLQKLVLQGKLAWPGSLPLILVSIMAGILVAYVFMYVVGLVFHLILNRWLKAGLTRKDAIAFPMMCLAPQIMLVFEIPFLIQEFGRYESYIHFLLLRVIADVLSVRVFYTGCRHLFKLSKRHSILVTLIPGIPVGLLVMGMIVLMLG